MTNAKDIKSYIWRDWATVAERKRKYWADRPEAGWRASAVLWQHFKFLHPEWPRPAERVADLVHHVRIAQLLQRASNDLSAD